MKSLSRRKFIEQGGIMASVFVMPLRFHSILNKKEMSDKKHFDVIIIGGSYSGLAAAMALGRALRKVLIIDSGKPCNRQTPHSHNFLTRKTEKYLRKSHLLQNNKFQCMIPLYFIMIWQLKRIKTENGFEVQTSSRDIFKSKRLIFATGIMDEIPNIRGFSECWGFPSCAVLISPTDTKSAMKQPESGAMATIDLSFPNSFQTGLKIQHYLQTENQY